LQPLHFSFCEIPFKTRGAAVLLLQAAVPLTDKEKPLTGVFTCPVSGLVLRGGAQSFFTASMRLTVSSIVPSISSPACGT
jgi:hypothetical protein